MILVHVIVSYFAITLQLDSEVEGASEILEDEYQKGRRLVASILLELRSHPFVFK